MNSTEGQIRSAIAEQASQWFVTHRSGELTDEQREEFIDWLRASPVHVREYLALTGLAADMEHVVQRFEISPDVLVSRAKVAPEAIRPVLESPGPSAKNRLFLGPWMTVAACALLGAALGWWYFASHPEYTTAHAEQRTWHLADGSTVHLNSQSKVLVRFDGARREVELLQGQAVFQVVKDSSRPFWVSAGDVMVKALGTEFDVYRQHEGAVVSVIEGKVAVWGDNAASGAPAVQLGAGEQVRLAHHQAAVSRKSEDVRKTVAWLQRQLVFDHDALGSAVAEFNRYNDTQIHIADAAIAATEVSGIFSAYDADSFVHFLERQPGMSVETHENTVLVRSAH